MITSIPAPNTAEITSHEIAKGYGVEDIAVMHSLKIEDVRTVVRLMRENGILERMFPNNTGSIS